MAKNYRFTPNSCFNPVFTKFNCTEFCILQTCIREYAEHQDSYAIVIPYFGGKHVVAINMA